MLDESKRLNSDSKMYKMVGVYNIDPRYILINLNLGGKELKKEIVKHISKIIWIKFTQLKKKKIEKEKKHVAISLGKFYKIKLINLLHFNGKNVKKNIDTRLFSWIFINTMR